MKMPLNDRSYISVRMHSTNNNNNNGKTGPKEP